MSDFAAYLHNPWGFPTPKEKAAMIFYRRKERFIEGYCWENKLQEIILPFFQNLNDLHKKGLKQAYEKLKQYVIDNHHIGLILLGTTIENDKIINNYKTVSGDSIELSLKSISRFLIRDYILKKNVENLCDKTPYVKKYINYVNNI